MELLVAAAGFVIIALASGRIGQGLAKTGLPLISGFLLTGILVGPYGLNLISSQTIDRLRFLDEIALGFIAFAAGSELYFKELRERIRSIAWITAGLVVSTFFLTGAALFALSEFLPFMAAMPFEARLGVSMLAGSILVARSPSSAIAIVTELRAKGPFTQTVLGVTVIMDAVVIALFAASSTVAGTLLSGVAVTSGFVFLLAGELGMALGAGWLVSRILKVFMGAGLPPSIKTAAVLATGYGVSEISSYLRHASHLAMGIEIFLEPLLICMTAGFLVANTTGFRKAFSRLLFDVGPPVYITFFTLTGASLSLDILARTWPIALALFSVRIGAIFLGTLAGGTAAGNPARSNRIAWMAFITQAGVGLGLAREVVVEFPEWGGALATIIIAVIVLNQLTGPPLFKRAIRLMNEDHSKAPTLSAEGNRRAVIFGSDGQAEALAASLFYQGWSVTLIHKELSGPEDNEGDIPRVRVRELTLQEMRKAGCDSAGAIVAMMSDDDNFTVLEIAYEHFGTRTLIARLNDRDNFGCFQALGVLIVDPSTAIVSLLDHFVRAPSAASLLMGMTANRRIVDLHLRNPDLDGLALRDLRLPLDTVVMSIRRRGVLLIPHGYTRLETGDLVTIIGSDGSLKEVSLRFGVNKKEAVKQVVARAAARELMPHPEELGAVFDGASRQKQDRFDQVVAQSRVLDLRERLGMDAFFDRVARELAGLLQVAEPLLKDLLVRRENEMTTVLAPGLAVPHIIIEGEGRFAMLLVRSRKGIEFSAAKPLVHAAFVLVGTRDERDFHLRALSAIAQIVLDPRFEKKWMRAASPETLKAIILTADRRRDA